MKALLIIVLSLLSVSLMAQKDTSKANQSIESVSLTAGGLTCSMCSKAIYKSLMKVPGVSKVDPDIENSGFTIYYKKDQPVNKKALEEAVEDAGFSVESIKINTASKRKEI